MLQFYLGGGYQPADHLLEMARVAEDVGFDGVSMPDHVVLPTTVTSRYPGTSDGSLAWDPAQTPWLDSWVSFSAIAAQTERLKLMSHVFVLPTRHPFHVAKAVGTLAAMFPGRVELGIGVGWSAEEFALLDSDFSQRGARMNEAIEVIRAVWANPTAAFAGKFYNFPDVAVVPRPAAPVPIYIGGTSDAALNRAAALGDGFIAMPGTIDEILTVLPGLWERLERNGRSREEFHVNVSLDLKEVDDLRRLDQAGVTSLQVVPWARDESLFGSIAEKTARLQQYAREMIVPYRHNSGNIDD